MTEDFTSAKACDCAATYDELAAMLVASYVVHNPLPAADLPGLYTNVRKAITGGPAAVPALEAVSLPSAAEIKKSIRPDGIVSFIDGKAYKTMKRHLTSHGLTPDTYRIRYGLSSDYPMVAQAYSEKRASLAKQIGLGQPGRAARSA